MTRIGTAFSKYQIDHNPCLGPQGLIMALTEVYVFVIQTDLEVLSNKKCLGVSIPSNHKGSIHFISMLDLYPPFLQMLRETCIYISLHFIHTTSIGLTSSDLSKDIQRVSMAKSGFVLEFLPSLIEHFSHASSSIIIPN